MPLCFAIPSYKLLRGNQPLPANYKRFVEALRLFYSFMFKSSYPAHLRSYPTLTFYSQVLFFLATGEGKDFFTLFCLN